MVSTSQKISCPLAIISSFFENYFPTNSNNGFHQQKNSSDQKTLFPLDRKSVSTNWMRDLLKNVFPLYREVASTLKHLKVFENIEKTGVHQQEYISSLSFFKFFLQVSIIVSTSKKTWNRTILFPVDKKLLSPSRDEGLAKNMFQLKNELFSPAAVDCCLRK